MVGGGSQNSGCMKKRAVHQRRKKGIIRIIARQEGGLSSAWVWVWTPLLSLQTTARCRTTTETHSSGSMCTNASTCPCCVVWGRDRIFGESLRHDVSLDAIHCALGLKAATRPTDQPGENGSHHFTSIFVAVTSRWNFDGIVAMAATLLPATGGRVEQMEGQMGQIPEMHVPSSSSASGSPTSIERRAAGRGDNQCPWCSKQPFNCRAWHDGASVKERLVNLMNVYNLSPLSLHQLNKSNQNADANYLDYSAPRALIKMRFVPKMSHFHFLGCPSNTHTHTHVSPAPWDHWHWPGTEIPVPLITRCVPITSDALHITLETSVGPWDERIKPARF